MKTTALIAEDEPLLAAHLRAELQRLWPQLDVVAMVGHGQAAVEQALALQPQVMFLDVRMPGMTGLEAAQAVAEDWPDDVPLPLLVFVTAYDQYALQAFEQAAIDYLLKPVQPERLAQTCSRLQDALQKRSQAGDGPGLDATLAQLRQLLGAAGMGLDLGHGAGKSGGHRVGQMIGNVGGNASSNTSGNTSANTSGHALGNTNGHAIGPPAQPALTVIQASVGAAIHLVKVDEVVYFEAADKYVRVVTVEREYLIRTSLKELLPQLDAQRFWQVHRGTVVRSDAIEAAYRDEAGKVSLSLRGHADRLHVSRLYAHLFKAM